MIPYPLTVFYDGACPLCSREMALMKRLDSHHRLRLCDFSAPGYDAESTGLDPVRLGAVLHAQWEDGTIITGVEVFRAVWQSVGLGLLARVSRLPVIDPLLIRGYCVVREEPAVADGTQDLHFGNVSNSRDAAQVNTTPAPYPMLRLGYRSRLNSEKTDQEPLHHLTVG
jgi:predicted DCC family thiol-disulfide oxidoreductase YuxK